VKNTPKHRIHRNVASRASPGSHDINRAASCGAPVDLAAQMREDNPIGQEEQTMARNLFAIMLTALLGVTAVAQEKFTIKLKTGAKGDVIQSTENDTETGKIKLTIMGMAQPKDEDKSVSSTFKEEIIEKEPGKKATKLKQTYQKAEMTIKGKKINPSFIGKEVLIERSGAKYTFTLNGAEMTGDDLAFMKDHFKDESPREDDDSRILEAILPKNPVAVGDTWKPDVTAVIKSLSGGETEKMKFDAAKSMAAGKLLKAYKKDGRQFGIFDVEIKVALTKIAAGPTEMDLDAASAMKMTLHCDVCIDGTVDAGSMEMKMEMKMAGALKAPNGVEVKLDADSKKVSTRTAEDLKGKK
jgi:hypothetical protein